MGVTGLWKLIEPCGKPVPVETLEGKILAVDISIWLHQVVKGFQDNKGAALVNSHLLGLFNRLCKLLYYRVRPVFVFDGCVPQLKRDTIARRQQQRMKLNSEADRIQVLLLQSLVKEKVVQQALGPNVSELLLKSPSKRISDKAEHSDIAMDDVFILPELRDATVTEPEIDYDTRTEEDDWQHTYSTRNISSTTTKDILFEESNLRQSYNSNLQAIDVHSEHFRKLPADVRHEILVDIKDTRKQSSWGRLHELPSCSDAFSSFQMKRLLKRRAVQESIEEVEQEMGDNTLSYAELEHFLIDKGIVEATVKEKESKQISSDENTRFIFVRDLKKKLTELEKEKDQNRKGLSEIKSDPQQEKENDEKEEMPSTSNSFNKKYIEKKNKTCTDKYNADLELAIAMSLEESCVYSQNDYDYDSDENLKLNREQRKQLRNSSIGPARTYMIEYAGMNAEEVVGIMDKTQIHSEAGEKVLEFVAQTEGEKVIGSTKAKELYVCNDFNLHVENEDTDFEEVAEMCEAHDKKSLDIVLKLEQPIAVQDDLFADIFGAEVNEGKEMSFVTADKLTNVKRNEFEKELHTERTNIRPFKMESSNALAILDDLKKEMYNIKNIDLTNVKINALANVIDVSDDISAETRILTTQATHVIEILDSDDARHSKTTPPQLKTPSKLKTISDYFETDYVIKKTPDKCNKQEEKVPKVRSPFFVNKRTPKMKGKLAAATTSNSTPSTSPMKDTLKAAKSLFASNTDKGSSMLSELSTKSNAALEDMKEAANILRDGKTAFELQALVSDLAEERRNLETERNQQNRMSMSISQRMVSECQELLRLFGIPYIVAPMEAEAQCAFLDVVNLTNGTITDDSDIWLFGGRTVYKNFFAQNKNVLEFRADEIEKTFNCDRKKLIQLACLVGSDYTTGVNGIGTVTALEILASFSTNDLNSNCVKNSYSEVSAVLSTLARFRDWWKGNKNSATPSGSSTRLLLGKKLKNIEIHDSFPSLAVINAYLAPKVDNSQDEFSWGYPNVDAIHEFTRKVFGWTKFKTDDILAPVIKKLKEKKSQATIRNYFTVKSAVLVRELKVSKRVQSAINKMNYEVQQKTPNEVPRPNARTKRTKRGPSSTPTKNSVHVAGTVNTLKADDDLPLMASISGDPPRNAKRPMRIPNTKDLIPQRKKNLQQLIQNNEKAAKVLKCSKTNITAAKKKQKQNAM